MSQETSSKGSTQEGDSKERQALLQDKIWPDEAPRKPKASPKTIDHISIHEDPCILPEHSDSSSSVRACSEATSLNTARIWKFCSPMRSMVFSSLKIIVANSLTFLLNCRNVVRMESSDVAIMSLCVLHCLLFNK